MVEFTSINEYERFVEQLNSNKESYQTKVIKGTRKSPRRLRVIILRIASSSGTNKATHGAD